MSRYQNIPSIAMHTIHTLREIGVRDYGFIGGMACALYTQGNGRRPKDLDIFCLSSYPGGAEAIKRHLCEANNQFYAVPAQNPKDEWNVLWWRTDSNDPDFQRFKYQES